VNAIFTSWPAQSTLVLTLPIATATTTASMLGYTGTVTWAPLTVQGAPGIKVTLPSFAPGVGGAGAPCENAWTIAFENVD